MYYDIIVIGAGVVGCGLARELSMFNGSLAVLDKSYDVADGASKANSGIVHAGYDAAIGSNKAKYNVEGARLYEALCKEVNAPYKRCGAMVVGFNEDDKKTLNDLYHQGVVNGVKELEIIDGEAARKLEPNLSPDVCCALNVPTSAITSPYELTYALADHAAVNGAKFYLETEVQNLEFVDGLWHLQTNKGEYTAKVVVNCTGIGSAKLHDIMSKKPYKIQPRRGEYYMLDRLDPIPFERTIFQTPSKMGKGVLVSPTVHGNTFLGPSSNDVEDGNDTSTTADILNFVYDKARITWPGATMRNVITTFAGMRAHEEHGDFVVGRVDDAPQAYEAVGIESPGLTAAPAIAVALRDMIVDDMKLTKKAEIVPVPHRNKPFIDMSDEERAEAAAKDPAYGKIVCRCEQVTEAEIRAAINRPVGGRSLDAIKRRARPGSGRCQGGFCSTRVLELLAEELKINELEVTKHGGESKILTGRIEEVEGGCPIC